MATLSATMNSVDSRPRSANLNKLNNSLPTIKTGTGNRQYTDMQLEQSKPQIPIVSHIISDEDVGLLQGQKAPINLNKVVKLLTDPHSAMLYDRHVAALRKVIKQYQSGFIMKDLVSVFKIMNVCADRVEGNPYYIQPMTEILHLCSAPFLKEKSSDEMAYEQIAVESIAQLGYLMRVPCNEIRIQICDTLTDFYSKKPPKQHLQRYKANTLDFNKKVIEKSDVAETLVKSLALLENDLDVKMRVLDVLQNLSRNSNSNCDQMLQAEIAHRLCTRLMDYDPSQQLLFQSVNILWNLLENGNINEVNRQLNNQVCIDQLQQAFIQLLTQGFSHFHRQLRNDLLVIASAIAQINPQTPFVECGFVKHLTLFATFQEVRSHNAIVKHLKLLQNHEDFELKKLFINILVLLSSDPAVIPILSEGKLLLALFSYVKANETTVGPRDWTVSQFEELQLQAMSALSHLGPLMIEDYMMCQGSTRLLLLLEWCVGSDEFGGSGNSLLGVGGRGNKRAQMRRCLRLIRSMVSTANENVLQDLSDQGAINQLTTILGLIASRDEKRVEDAIDLEMQYDMLLVLSALCENDPHRKELFGNAGVDILIRYLKMDPKLLTSGLGHNTLLLAAIDCVWCAVVGCYITEDYYLEKDGVFLLMDMLETCPKSTHNLVLGCLLDLTENPKTISHILAWRGDKDVTAGHLLCHIWRQEESDIGVVRDANGGIADVKRPLIGELQEQQGIVPLPANCPSQAIVDVSENMRAKIYAIFCKIGFVDLAGLTTADHVTLTIVEHYLDFKLGEVWTEMMSELEQEDIRPITPDREALEAISRTVDDRADHVLQVQKELLEAQNQQDLIDEQEHYAEIRDHHRQKEKAMKNFSEYVARTSNYTLLKAAKERQELSIDASRIQTNYKALDNFHSTDLTQLNTTTFSGRFLNVESVPAELTGGPLATYNPTTGTLAASSRRSQITA